MEHDMSLKSAAETAEQQKRRAEQWIASPVQTLSRERFCRVFSDPQPDARIDSKCLERKRLEIMLETSPTGSTIKLRPLSRQRRRSRQQRASRQSEKCPCQSWGPIPERPQNPRRICDCSCHGQHHQEPLDAHKSMGSTIPFGAYPSATGPNSSAQQDRQRPVLRRTCLLHLPCAQRLGTSSWPRRMGSALHPRQRHRDKPGRTC